MATNNEMAVREAAAALKQAIDVARTDGYVIAWPTNSDGLASISISETGRAPVTVQVRAGEISPGLAEKAAVAAQAAVDKVLEEAGAEDFVES